ncbi:hypothetical protein E4U21_004904 [Claviceps maximensis]|nr:hypothetical protein E4U21_004904 [Claviceps maximensis]
MSYQSTLISADEARRTGCFTTLPIRIHPLDDVANAASRRFVRDWEKIIGDGLEKQTHFSFSPVGNWSSLIYPEAITERLAVLAYLSDLGLIHDDTSERVTIEEARGKHDDLRAALDPDNERIPEADADADSRASKTKKLVSQCILECVELDHELGLEMLAAFRNVWLAISERNSDKEAQNMEEYLRYRSENGGMLVFWPMLQFSLGICLSEAEHALVQPIIDAATEGLLLANDYFSWERERRELQSGRSKRIVSAVELFVRTRGLSMDAAKREVKRAIIKAEQDFCERRDRLYETHPDLSLNLKRWVDCAGLAVSGNHYWCSACPRQNAWKEEAALSDGNEMKKRLSDSVVPRTGDEALRPAKKRKERKNSEDAANIANAAKANRSGTGESTLGGRRVSGYPLYKPSDLAIDAPAQYISSMPSKGIRSVLIDALNVWLHVPQAALKTISSVVNTLHTASLILDDVEDNSPLRRGFPAAHTIFGPAQSINSANFMFVRAVQEAAQKLRPVTLAALLEELEGLYFGQSWDLYWKHNLACPSEAEYVNMVDHKTGGMFRMLLRMMQAEKEDEEDEADEEEKDGVVGVGRPECVVSPLDFARLTLLFGRFFQIRDDYMNLGHYASQKGLCEDLDEGKFSYPIVCCLATHPEYRGHILGVFRQRPTAATSTASSSFQSALPPECKMHLMTCLDRSGALDQTLDCLRELERELELEIGRLEREAGETNPMLRLCLAKLSVKGIVSVGQK